MNRIAAALVLAACVTAAASAGAAPAGGGPRMMLKVALLGIGGGVAGDFQSLYGAVDGRVLQVAAGPRVSRHVGLLVGTMLVRAMGPSGLLFPATASMVWDFDPDRLGVRRAAYVGLAWYHTNLGYYSNGTGWVLGAGFGWTFYAVTPHLDLELLAPGWVHKGWRASLGLDLGGTYVHSPRRWLCHKPLTGEAWQAMHRPTLEPEAGSQDALQIPSPH